MSAGLDFETKILVKTDAPKLLRKELASKSWEPQTLAIITKNALIARDADLLGELARHGAAAAFISITSLDGALARVLEPRAAQPHLRLETVAKLAAAGVPVGVMVAPVIPGLTDHEMPAILEAAARAGASHAGYVPLRLPFGVSALFEEFLERHFGAWSSRPPRSAGR